MAYLLARRSVLKWLGPILLALALAGSGVAYFSGESVKDKADDQGVPRAAVEKHEETCLWALGALGLATLLSWAVRPKGGALWLSAAVALVAVGLTLYTAYLGGRLVYVHGAGRVKPPPAHEEGKQ